MYAYAANNPVKYTDPDGRLIDLSELDNDELNTYKAAREELLHTLRGAQIIVRLEKSKEVYTLKINNKCVNGYNPSDNSIQWDPNKTLVTGDCKELSPESLLLHELGHAYQDDNTPLPEVPTQEEKYSIENYNVFINEVPVAKQRDEGIRIDYYDWIYSIKDGRIYNVNTGFIGPKPKDFYNKLLYFLMTVQK